MRIRGEGRLLILLLCAVLASFAFLSVMVAAEHIAHDCNEEICVICAVIHGVQRFMRQLSLLVWFAWLALAASLGCIAVRGSVSHHRRAQTPISLKIRLNP